MHLKNEGKFKRLNNCKRGNDRTQKQLAATYHNITIRSNDSIAYLGFWTYSLLYLGNEEASDAVVCVKLLGQFPRFQHAQSLRHEKKRCCFEAMISSNGSVTLFRHYNWKSDDLSHLERCLFFCKQIKSLSVRVTTVTRTSFPHQKSSESFSSIRRRQSALAWETDRASNIAWEIAHASCLSTHRCCTNVIP